MRNGLRRRGAGRLEMRTSTSDRLTAVTMEQLLEGGPGPAGLHQLLAAAAGPGTASELAGETAAVAAFVDAPRASPLPSAPPRRPSMLSTALSKILAAKALAAVVLLAGATGGVALAATVSDAPSSPSDDQTTVTSTPTATPAPSDDPESEGEGRPDPSESPSPQPSLAGLCKAWAAGATDNDGKAADNPAFRALVEAAGSTEKVPVYCADLPDADQPGRSGNAPGHSDEEPDGPPADRPGAAAERGVPPTAAPGNPDHPTGPPADRAEEDGDAQEGNGQDGDGQDGDGQDGDTQDKGTRSRPDNDSPATDRRPAN